MALFSQQVYDEALIKAHETLDVGKLANWEEIPHNDHYLPEEPLDIYLREMSGVPLLSHEEEIQLAQRIERGRRAQKSICETVKNLTEPEMQELKAIVRDGSAAREHLIRANTRLVIAIARRYMNCGVNFSDLIQEGNLGLIRAVEKFEFQRGFRFSTYATWWIRQAIMRAIAVQSRTIRLPVYLGDIIRHLNQVAHKMEQELGRPPNHNELAEEVHETPEKVKWFLQVTQVPLSLENPYGDDEENEMGAYIVDETAETPIEMVQTHMLEEKVEMVLGTLTPREARVIRLRYGLDNSPQLTLEEVGEKFGLTRERIRQIELQALRRLRHPCRSRVLREYL